MLEIKWTKKEQGQGKEKFKKRTKLLQDNLLVAEKQTKKQFLTIDFVAEKGVSLNKNKRWKWFVQIKMEQVRKIKTRVVCDIEKRL